MDDESSDQSVIVPPSILATAKPNPTIAITVSTHVRKVRQMDEALAFIQFEKFLSETQIDPPKRNLFDNEEEICYPPRTSSEYEPAKLGRLDDQAVENGAWYRDSPYVRLGNAPD